jgi:hypothetical protein
MAVDQPGISWPDNSAPSDGSAIDLETTRLWTDVDRMVEVDLAHLSPCADDPDVTTARAGGWEVDGVSKRPPPDEIGFRRERPRRKRARLRRLRTLIRRRLRQIHWPPVGMWPPLGS